MSRGPTPMALMAQQSRPQEMGKIRLGIRDGKRPKSIDTFRFTSSDEGAIAILAELYGGTPAWSAKDRWWDVVTEAREIDVILPPDPLGGTPIYELWSGAGCQRRCDGEVANVMVRQGDDVDYHQAECVCAAQNRLECKPTTRLSVIIPQVRLGGVWQLKSNSWAAAREMQPMVAMVELAQAKGLVAAKLRTETRVQQGSKRPFTVPLLVLDSTVAELAAGEGGVQLPRGGGSSTPALPAAPVEPDPVAGELMVSDDVRARMNGLWAKLTPDQQKQMARWMTDEAIDVDELTASAAAKVVARLTAFVAENEEPF